MSRLEVDCVFQNLMKIIKVNWKSENYQVNSYLIILIIVEMRYSSCDIAR